MPDFPFMPLPRNVRQSDGRSCWAAAMESWLDATPGRNWVPQEMLYLEMHEIKGALSNGMLTVPKGAKALCTKYKLQGKAFPQNKLKSLTGKFLMERMKKKGYLWMAFDYYNLPGHVVVVYGLKNDPITGEDLLYAMDPIDTAAYTHYPLEDYKYGARQFFVAWKA